MASKLTARQKAVIRTGAANVADRYNLKPKGEQRFRSSMKKALTQPGSKNNKTARAYIHTTVAADRWATTNKEASGARKVLNKAYRAGNSNMPAHSDASNHAAAVASARQEHGF